MSSVFVPGNVVLCSYPSDNRINARTRLEPRRIVVRRERDLHFSPLDPISIQRRPRIRRGQLLIHAYDLDRCSYRKFYFDSMRSLRVSTQPLMQIGVYDFFDSEPRFIGRLLTDSRADMAHAREVLKNLNNWLYEQDTGQVARLFPVPTETTWRIA